MKYLLLIFLFVLPITANSQNNDSEINYYFQKSNSKRKTGNALLITGGGLILTGFLVASSGNNGGYFFSPNQIAGAGILSLGVLSALVSVPFYISAHHNKNKYLRISPTAEISHLNLVNQNENYALVGLKFNF